MRNKLVENKLTITKADTGKTIVIFTASSLHAIIKLHKQNTPIKPIIN
jgi:hypothetical protein